MASKLEEYAEWNHDLQSNGQKDNIWKLDDEWDIQRWECWFRIKYAIKLNTLIIVILDSIKKAIN